MAGTALAASFVEHRTVLLRYLRARGAGDEAEDVLQELWLKLHQVETIAGDNRAYLFRMTHNLMLDRARAATRRRAREHAFEQDRMSAGRDDAPAIDRALLAREQLTRVETVLRSLGERGEFIFRRYRLDNVPQRDIAAELGISLSAVEKHLQKAYRAVAQAQNIEADGAANQRGSVDHVPD